LSRLHLGFLKTEEVGIELTEDITEAFALTGAQTIYIPTDKFHVDSKFLGLRVQS
jgi:hypothetical protein